MSTTGVPSIASSGPTSELEPVDPEHRHAMESDRVRAVGRPRREDAGQGPGLVVARVDLQDAAVGLVQPRQDDQLVADADPLERVRDRTAPGGSARRVPLLPCRGASARARSDERTTPIGLQAGSRRRHGSRYRCVIRIWFPEGSRKPASTPYGCSVGSCWNSTPRALSSSYVAWTSSVGKKSPLARPWRRPS